MLLVREQADGQFVYCCYTNQQNVVIVFGCIVAIITIAVYYFTIREQYKKVMPLQNAHDIATIDKYAIAL